MAELFHITERETWLAAARTGQYRMSTRGTTLETQGFIHCSLRHQLPAVAEFVYGDVPDDELVVLVIDGERVGAAIRFEATEPDGPEYPHVYGAIPVGAVTDTFTVRRDGAGHLVVPPRPES